jgi:hypothetical protein
MKRFKMTSDRFHFWVPVALVPILLVQLGGVFWATPRLAQPVVGQVVSGVVVVVFLLLVVTTLLTPTAVRLSHDALFVERLLWPAFRVPLSELTGVEVGPVSKVLSGDVGRVAGVGGWFWSGGLFRAKGVGLVRAWLRRLGPTVVVRRAHGLPLLFGNDDPEGLRAALIARLR